MSENELVQVLKEIRDIQEKQLKSLESLEHHFVSTRDYAQGGREAKRMLIGLED